MALTSKIVWQGVCSPGYPMPKILGSRIEVATLSAHKKPIRSYCGQMTSITIEMAFDPDTLRSDDRVVIQFGANQETLIGNDDNFGLQWANWVWNVEVQSSAINHILRIKPALAVLVFRAIQPTVLADAFDSWMGIARTCLSPTDVAWLHQATLKGRQWPTPTAAAAMPLRIAGRLKGWHPPIPRPEFPTGQSAVVLVPLPVEQK